jgi:hypothetical protein
MNRPLAVYQACVELRAGIRSALDRRVSTQEFPTFDGV